MIDAVVVASAKAWTQSDKMTYWIIWVPFGLNVRTETRQLFPITYCSDEVSKVFLKIGVDDDDRSMAAGRKYQYEKCGDIIRELCSYHCQECVVY